MQWETSTLTYRRDGILKARTKRGCKWGFTELSDAFVLDLIDAGKEGDFPREWFLVGWIQSSSSDFQKLHNCLQTCLFYFSGSFLRLKKSMILLVVVFIMK